MPTYRKDSHLGHGVQLVETDDISNDAISTEKIKDGAVVWDKLGNDVKNRVNAMASINISVSPKVVLKNTLNVIHIEAICYYDADVIRIKRNGIDIAAGTGKLLTFDDSITPTGSDNIVYTAEFIKGNDVKSVDTTLQVAMPIYWGAGSSYQDAHTMASARISPEGEYHVTVSHAGDYVFFVVPNSMAINHATMNGIMFPLDEAENVVVDGSPYKAYRSSNAYTETELTIVIS